MIASRTIKNLGINLAKQVESQYAERKAWIKIIVRDSDERKDKQ